MSRLLNTPSEIRHLIWTLAFGCLDFSPETPDDWMSDWRNCQACSPAMREDKGFPAAHPFNECFQPLLTCKQVWNEGSPIFFSTLNLCILTRFTLQGLAEKEPPRRLLSKITTITIMAHIDDNMDGEDWVLGLTALLQACSSLTTVNLYHHMQPPHTMDIATDVITFASPLILSNLVPQEDDQQQEPEQEEGIDKERRRQCRNPRLNLNFDYAWDDVMVESPVLGTLNFSLALEEHSKVVKDLIYDPMFQRAVLSDDWDVMSARVEFFASDYEQPAIERLQRKRARELAQAESEEQEQIQEQS